MDVVADADQGCGNAGEESLSGIESKKHRMTTGQDSEGFAKRYQLLEQLGSGASGTVWKCRLAPGQGRTGGDEPLEGVIYAAKIIDLRPFKLRERFSMQRLMREVEIMRRLRHPNIIRLVEALDTAEQLVLVLEYAPGVELFDAILSKNSFSEEEARPVFVQVARALQYMHSMQIVHRDVKPENVMIIDRPSAGDKLYPEAKLLDFGLSKAIDADGGGSVARTFVGTPSYLAPEVEEKPGGRGKPYGTPVDCWSLGAMLYVMLVARFPEFQVQGVRKYVRMQGPSWDKISTEAKQLIQHLMAFDPGARLTVDKALRHPWLRELAEKEPLPPPRPVAQPVPSGMHGMAPLPENMAFTVPAAVMAASAGRGRGGADGAGPLDSPGSRPSLTGSGGSGGGGWASNAWGGGRPPIVTEQETPPASKHKKSFEFSPSGPTIRELHSDESPLSSIDSGMGEKVEDGHEQGSAGGDGHNSKFSKNRNIYNSGAHGQSNNSSSRMNVDSGAERMYYERMKERETAVVALYDGAQGMGITMPPDGGVPLLQLQNRIAACLETAVTTYSDCPEAAASLRRSAALCRESLRDSVTLLRKIERTAAQVLTLFPDLTLAVEEGEPDLAHDFFATVKGWVREMYTAVSLVQAKNSANAKQVGEAMERHAEMGLDSRYRQQKQQQAQQQPQPQPPHHSEGTDVDRRGQRAGNPGEASIGGGGYVAREIGERNTRGLSGDLQTDAARQSDLIAVDPDTFKAVRQIQELRNKIAADEGRKANSSSSSTAGARTTTDSNPTTPVEVLSDEKLINLFLLMARGPKFNAGKIGSVPGTGSENSAGTAGVPTSASRDRRDMASGSSGRPGEDKFLGGVEAMFAVPKVEPMARGLGEESPQTAGAMASDDSRMANLTAQMSIEDGGFGNVAAGGSGGTPAVSRRNGNDQNDGDCSGGGRRAEQRPVVGMDSGEERMWGGRKEHELQLARRHGDDVYTEVQRALQMLHEVDSVLEQLALFWANSEVIFDVLLRKGDLVEKFVAFANKPRLLHRFNERLADYKRFWEGVQGVCNKYVCGQLHCTGCTNGSGGAGGGGGGGGGNAHGGGTTVLPHDRPPSGDGDSSFGEHDGPTATTAGSDRASKQSSTGSGSDVGVGTGIGMGFGSTGSAGSREGTKQGRGAGLRQGLGGAGGWSNVEMGMDAPYGRGGRGGSGHGV